MIVNANAMLQYVTGIMKHVKVGLKIIVRADMIIAEILAHVFVRIVSI